MTTSTAPIQAPAAGASPVRAQMKGRISTGEVDDRIVTVATLPVSSAASSLRCNARGIFTVPKLEKLLMTIDGGADEPDPFSDETCMFSDAFDYVRDVVFGRDGPVRPLYDMKHGWIFKASRADLMVVATKLQRLWWTFPATIVRFYRDGKEEPQLIFGPNSNSSPLASADTFNLEKLDRTWADV